MSGFLATVSFFVLLLPDVTSVPNQTCGNDVKRMEALPGEGWDALLGRPMSRVLAATYKECRLTEDKEFLIPDDVYVTAIKESEMKISSELIDHWSNYSIVTSASFDVGAGFFFEDWVIGWSFSTEYQNAKTRQVEDKSVTMRNLVRVNRYALESSLTADVDDRLMKLLMETIDQLESGDQEQAEVSLELIVRQYGTHFVTQVYAGAILVDETYFERQFLQTSGSERVKISSSAGAIFLEMFGINAKFKIQIDEKTSEGYLKSLTSRDIRAIGGSIVQANMTLDEWVKEIPNNLVVIDRSGLPLTFLINRDRFPHVNATALKQLVDLLESVLSKYYTINSHVGCMNPDSPNFDFTANIDSGLCEPPANNFSLGGGFLECQDKVTDNGRVCDELRQINPVTNGFSCPQNYEKILLTNGTFTKPGTKKVCVDVCVYYLFIAICGEECTVVSVKSTAQYSGYWCYNRNPLQNTGQMFGGSYTSFSKNINSQAQSCPKTYIPVRVAPDLFICISNDYDIGLQYDMNFAGLFGCKNGNPFNKKAISFFSEETEETYLPGCPAGFTQHTATVDNGCEIKYCVASAKTYQHVQIIRPPFRSQQSLFTNAVYEPKNVKKNEKTETVRPGPVIGIVIACLVVLASIVAMVVYARNRRRRRLQEDGAAEREPIMRSGYTSIGRNDSAVNVET